MLTMCFARYLRPGCVNLNAPKLDLVKVYVCGKNSGLTRGRLCVENPFQSLLSPFYLLQIHVQITVVVLPHERDRLAYSPAGVWRVEEPCKGGPECPLPSSYHSLEEARSALHLLCMGSQPWTVEW